MGFLTLSKRVCLAVGIVAALASCAKKSEKASLEMNFDWHQIRSKDLAYRGKVSSLSAPPLATLNMVVVNATGAPKPFSWDRHNQPDPDTAVAPTSIELDGVKQGKGIIVQVVALFESSAGMEFYYGSKTIDIGSASPPAVDITITNLVTGAITEGDFVGQFVPATGAPPTGRVSYMFNPPDGGPQVLVHQTEMFRGWIRLTALSTKLLTFSSSNPVITSLLSDATILNDSMFNNGYAAQAVRVRVPAHSADESHDNSFDMSDRGESVLNIGFFGPGATSLPRKVCYSGVIAPIPNLFMDSTHTGGQEIQWYGKNVPPGAPAKYAFVEGVSATPFKGGLTTAENGSCAVPSVGVNDEFVHYIKFDPLAMVHSDSVVPFRGPFIPVSFSNGYAQYVTLTANGPNYDIAWKVLPGMTNTDFGGAVVFHRQVLGDSSDDNELRKNDGFACEEMAAGKFSPAFASVSVNPLDQLLTINTPDVSKLQAIVCVKDDTGRFYNGAVMAYQSGGGYQSYDLKMIYQTTPGQNVFLTGTCKEFKLEIGQNGVPHNATEAVSLSLAVQGGNLLHTEATCNGGGSGAAGAVLSIAAGASVSQSFWVRQPSAATNMFMASSSTPAYTNTHLNNSSLAFYSPSPSYNAVKIMSDAAMAVGVCYPVQVTLLSGAGFGGSSGSVGIDLSTNILAGTFHLAANCGDGPLATGGSPDVTIPAYTHSANLYFSPTSATSGGAMTATTVGTAFTNALSANAGLNTHTGYKVKVEGPAREFDLANTCLPVRIEAVNSVGARVTSPIARTLTATVASGGILYSTPNCTGGTNIPSKSFSMAAAGNTSNEIVYAELDNSSNHFEFNIVDSSLVGSPFNGTGLQIFAKQLSNFRIVRDDLLPMNSVMTKLCYKAKVQSLNDGFGTTPVNADTQVDLSVPGGSGIVYATDSACVGTSNLGSVTIPRGASVSNGFYIMTTSYGANACDAILSRTSGHSPSSGTYPCAAVNTHQLYVEKVSVADLKVTLHDSFSAATVANLPIQFNVSLSGGCTIGGQSNFTAQISQGNSFYTNTVSGTSCTATVTHIPNALFTPHSIFWITGSPTF